MSKRQKFVFITWVGPNVSVIRRAKMSIDKAMVKSIVKVSRVPVPVDKVSALTACVKGRRCKLAKPSETHN